MWCESVYVYGTRKVQGRANGTSNTDKRFSRQEIAARVLPFHHHSGMVYYNIYVVYIEEREEVSEKRRRVPGRTRCPSFSVTVASTESSQPSKQASKNLCLHVDYRERGQSRATLCSTLLHRHPSPGFSIFISHFIYISHYTKQPPRLFDNPSLRRFNFNQSSMNNNNKNINCMEQVYEYNGACQKESSVG